MANFIAVPTEKGSWSLLQIHASSELLSIACNFLSLVEGLP